MTSTGKYLRTAGAVVEANDVEGRYLVAAADLDADHPVYKSSAYAFALHEESAEYCCARCFAVANNDGFSITCDDCELVYYCSEKCRDDHEEEDSPSSVPHYLVCPGLQMIGPLERQNTLVKPRLILEILARRFAPSLQAKDDAGFELVAKADGEPSAAANAPAQPAKKMRKLAIVDDDGSTAEPAADAIAADAPATDAIVADAPAADAIVADAPAAEAEPDEFAELQFHKPTSGWTGGMTDGASVFGGEQSVNLDQWCDNMRAAINACEFSLHVPPAEITNDALCEIASRFDINGFDGMSASWPNTPLGIGVYLGGASLFNHSCDPSCTVTNGVTSLTVKTRRAVKAGESLTITYINTSMYSSCAHRRHRLQFQYAFDCICSKCVVDHENEKPMEAPPMLRKLHGHGAHYALAAAIAGAGYWLRAILLLIVYFWWWTRVRRYAI